MRPLPNGSVVVDRYTTDRPHPYAECTVLSQQRGSVFLISESGLSRQVRFVMSHTSQIGCRLNNYLSTITGDMQGLIWGEPELRT